MVTYLRLAFRPKRSCLKRDSRVSTEVVLGMPIVAGRDESVIFDN
jgi:hypothetical protein